jgi:outer membrane protein assembly factor BamB
MRGLALAALAVTGTGGFAVTTLPRPPFPGPVASAAAPTHMRIVSSRYIDPGQIVEERAGRWPRSSPGVVHGAERQRTIRQGEATFVLYGTDGASARYLLAFDSKERFRYGFDFKNYVWPPRIRSGEREFVYEEIETAREADGVLYVENAHLTYARSSYNRNAYIAAIDLRTNKRLWRSPALVANARSFVLAGRYLVTGYGFTAEPDYLYLLDRRTGRVVERLKLPSAPERITRKGDRLTVRTYDHVVVVQLKNA